MVKAEAEAAARHKVKHQGGQGDPAKATPAANAAPKQNRLQEWTKNVRYLVMVSMQKCKVARRRTPARERKPASFSKEGCAHLVLQEPMVMDHADLHIPRFVLALKCLERANLGAAKAPSA